MGLMALAPSKALEVNRRAGKGYHRAGSEGLPPTPLTFAHGWRGRGHLPCRP